MDGTSQYVEGCCIRKDTAEPQAKVQQHTHHQHEHCTHEHTHE